MNRVARWRRWLIPAGVFLGVAMVHFLWRGFFPESDPAQDRWAAVPTHATSWLTTYVQSESYWLGFSYAFSLAFAAAAFRRYREGRLCAARNLAIGGVTFTGVLSVTGCYLLGCCGSPMLGVYVSLFGVAFIPWAKPLAALLTLLSIGVAWWWLNRRMRATSADSPSDGHCMDHNCSCNGVAPSKLMAGEPKVPV